jgi:flavin reductase (DIM6/NTAB) family NADH-FMN oxidoreductase RutF
VKKKIKEFIPLRLPSSQVIESVFLEYAGNRINITGSHGIFCQEPFVIGVWRKEILQDHAECDLIIYSGENKQVTVKLALDNVIKLEGHTLYLFNATGIQASILQRIKLRYLQFRTRTKQPLKLFRLFAALYSYPRKIILTSFGAGDHFNLFPMDFQGYIEQENIVLLGLRNTNITLQYIIEQKQVVVADFDLDSIRPVYDLGKHHSTKPPHPQHLGFAIIHTDELKFPIPAFAPAYKEVSVLNTLQLGSHTLIIGKVINSTSPATDRNLYHISQIEFSCNGHYRQFVID